MRRPPDAEGPAQLIYRVARRHNRVVARRAAVRPRDVYAPGMCLGVVHLDVATLDVARSGVEGIRTAEQLDGESIAGDKCWVVRAARLTLVERQDGESAAAQRPDPSPGTGRCPG